MPKKRFSTEQIVTLLRQIEVSMAQGKPTPMDYRRGSGLLAGCTNDGAYLSAKLTYHVYHLMEVDYWSPMAANNDKFKRPGEI